MKIICIFFLVLFFYESNSADIKGVVKTKSGVLNESVIYIEKIEGKIFQPPAKPYVVDQKDLTFIPHVLPILVGSTVDFPNNDNTRHNVFSADKIKKFDFGTYEKGAKKALVFDKPGVVPLLCHVHPEMSAYIVVVETPYFAMSNSSGQYEIKNVPQGKYKLTAWNEFTKKKTVEITINNEKDIKINFILEEN